MEKEEFLRRLERLLDDIPAEERADALAFYRSYFEDAGEENEEKILKELESPEKVAESIRKNLGAPDSGTDASQRAESPWYGDAAYGGTDAQTVEELQKENRKRKKQNAVLIAVLAVLTSPVWIVALIVLWALAIAAFAIVFALVVSLVAITAAAFAAGFALCGVGLGWLFSGGIAVGLGVLSGGCFLLALGLLAVVAVVWCFGKFLPWAVKGIVSLCKKLFEKRKERGAS